MSATVNFSCLSGKLIFEKSCFSSKNTGHERTILKKHFNYSVSLICPGLERPPVVWFKKLVDTEIYKVNNVPAFMLVEEEFLGGFVRNGQVQVLSHDTHIDTDDSLAVLPNGQLILNITKNTYQSLGLQGHPSYYCIRRKPNKYVVEVKLQCPSFLPGKKNYERVLKCLKLQKDLTFDLLIHWTPPCEDICPSSIQVYFEKKGFKTSKLTINKLYREASRLCCPVINHSQYEAKDSSCGCQDVYEWLGCVACDINLDNITSESYMSNLSCPTPSQISQTGSYYQMTGMFLASDILDTLQSISSSMKDYPDCPWICLTVHGFSDAPVSNNRHEHGYHQSGDNSYSFIIFPDEKYWSFRATGLYDVT